MPLAHQKFYTMLLRRNGIFLGDLEDLDLLRKQLIAARRLIGFLDRAGNGKGGLLRQPVVCGERRFIDVVLHDNTLANARAVAQVEKLYFPARTLVVEPTAKCNVVPDLVLQVFYIYILPQYFVKNSEMQIYGR